MKVLSVWRSVSFLCWALPSPIRAHLQSSRSQVKLYISDSLEIDIRKPGMPRALLTTLATKNRRLQILDHTRVPLHLEEDISGCYTFLLPWFSFS